MSVTPFFAADSAERFRFKLQHLEAEIQALELLTFFRDHNLSASSPPIEKTYFSLIMIVHSQQNIAILSMQKSESKYES